VNTVLKTFLSMSVSGSLLILLLLAGKQLWKDRVSRQWQYYIWLVVLLRLLLPFGTEINIMGEAYQSIEQAVTLSLPRAQAPAEPERQEADALPEASPTAPAPVDTMDTAGLLLDRLWLIWPAAALGLLIRKITIYQSFVRYVSAGSTPVSDVEVLDRLAAAAEETGVRRPVELQVNPLVSSPLLTGFFRPCVVLPSLDVSEKDFRYIILHELTHYKRRDMLYKWLVQVTVCLHWFNPAAHLMGREITNACEFSCDEAVLSKTGRGCARDYGNTLLDAMAAVGKYKESIGAVTLSENTKLLKERITAIMNFQKKSNIVRVLTGALTVCMIFGAASIGVYSAAAADSPAPVSLDKSAKTKDGTSSSIIETYIEKYYEAGSLPLFQIAFSRLDAQAQEKWLDRIYADGDFASFSVAVRGLDTNSSLFADFAEKSYTDGEIAFFSILTDCMDETELELWLDQALEDGKWNFQSMLFDKLDRNDEFDELKDRQEKEWEAAQKAEYQAAGVTMDGKDYYYQGQLVNIFLDIRPNKSFYTLNMNPEGTVNIKIVRNADNRITGVAGLTDAEMIELFGDEDGPDDMETIPVSLKTVVAGESVFLGEYTLSYGDTIRYDIRAASGNRMRVYFAKEGRKDVVYWSVNNLQQPGEELRCAADFNLTAKSPAKPGTYQLYLQAPDGALGGVKGNVFIEKNS
jgi:beta-lactamase regulating signal transducer with metallopeptidase domain